MSKKRKKELDRHKKSSGRKRRNHLLRRKLEVLVHPDLIDKYRELKY
jgi:hypothetical protein